MKKILLYTALGAAMLASCSQDESLETIERRGGELSFRTTVGTSTRLSTGTATRANIADLDMVKTDGFKVTAYLYGMDGETKKVQTTPYFEDMAVTWNADAWSHAQRYWPGSNETVETGVAAKGFDFVAYSPSATTGVSYDDNKMKITDYTIPAAVADEKDLVVANAQNQTEAANGTNGVSLDFKHVLSQVVVKATNASSFYHIDVEKVEIHNVHGKGTLTYDYAATSPVAWAATDATVSSNAYTSALASAATLGTTASALHANSNYYMMLPQTSGVWNPETEAQTAAGAYFVVSCKIYSGEGTNKEYLFGIGSASGYGRVAIPVPANGTGTNEGKLVWENGKKYTYTLNFFKDGGGAGYQEPGSTAPSKSITPSTVKFSASVSVEAWGEGSTEVPTDPNLLLGNFSVSATKKVQFTKGNLYWNGSDYKFETNQYDFPTTRTTSHVGHFFWHTSEDVTAGNYPYAQSWSCVTQTVNDKFFCGEDNKMTVDDTPGLYALSRTEWIYLLNTSGAASGARTQTNRFAKATVNGKTGLLIFPDEYNGITTGIDEGNMNSTTTTTFSTIDDDTWSTMQSAGVVFLPVAGLVDYDPTTIVHSTAYGLYWTSTPYEIEGCEGLAHCLFFCSDFVDPAYYYNRLAAFPLRLVKTVE